VKSLVKFALIQILILTISAAASVAQRGQAYQQRRAHLLAELKKCDEPGPKQDCHEDVVYEIAKLYRQGDHSVLKNLMDALPKSDGALSEGLGDVFSDLLCDHPRVFLTAVSKRPQRERQNLLFFAATADGSGMGCKHIGSLRQSLRAIKKNRNDKLHRLAGECLAMVDKYNPFRIAQ